MPEARLDPCRRSATLYPRMTACNSNQANIQALSGRAQFARSKAG